MGNEFTATHTVPECGLPAWARPDPQVAPIATLGGWLPIQLLERLGDWAHIRCENGWEAWTDARPLIEPAASAARSDADDGTILCPQCGKQLDERDPYPAHMADAHGIAVPAKPTEPSAGDGLVAALDSALDTYRDLVERFKRGDLDEATFRRRAFEVGLVVRDGDAWMLDLTTHQWWHYDGVRLASIAGDRAGPQD